MTVVTKLMAIAGPAVALLVIILAARHNRREPGQLPNPSQGVREKMRAGKKIAAIRLYRREVPGISLLDATRQVERMSGAAIPPLR